MSSQPVEDLAVLVDHVFFPILNNPLNQEGWPNVVIKDILEHIQELRNIVAEVKGNMINQTILPMPIIIDRVVELEPDIVGGNLELCDLKMKNSIEGIVMKWAEQINGILKDNSSSIFRDNPYPVPSHEITFWKSRRENLENIYKQLTDLRIKAVGSVLEAIDSVYYSPFQITFKNTVAALHEARDITLWLTPFVIF